MAFNAVLCFVMWTKNAFIPPVNRAVIKFLVQHISLFLYVP